MAHPHPVYDTEPHFTINPVTRQIEPIDSNKTTIIQYDHNSEMLTFEMPRYVDSHDMAVSNKIEIHYLNTSGHSVSKGVYPVRDLTLDEAGENISFTWLISQNATLYKGKLDFLIRFTCLTGTEVDYVWNTAIYSGISVSQGIDNSGYVAENYVDILEAWKQEVYSDFQADWNTNDSHGVGFVKNRTHYVEEYVEILPRVKGIPTSTSGLFEIDEIIDNIIGGDTYIVEYNGVDYTLVAEKWTSNPDGTGKIMYTLGAGNKDASPFLIRIIPDDFLLIKVYDGATTASIAIRKPANIVHKLDNKFLDIDWFPKNRIEKSWIIPEQAYTFHETNGKILYTKEVYPPINLVVGETYSVVWDGVTYDCGCWQSVISGTIYNNLGDSSEEHPSGEPFLIRTTPLDEESGLLVINSNDLVLTHRVGVYKPEKVLNKLPEEYLPAPAVFTTTDKTTASCNKTFAECLANIENKNFTANFVVNTDDMVMSNNLTSVFYDKTENKITYTIDNSSMYCQIIYSSDNTIAMTFLAAEEV